MSPTQSQQSCRPCLSRATTSASQPQGVPAHLPPLPELSATSPRRHSSVRSAQGGCQSGKRLTTCWTDHDIIVINGLQQICNVIHLADAVKRRTQQRPVHGYLASRWILDRLPEDQKQRIRAHLFSLDLLLCCDRQIDFAAYGCPRSQTIIQPNLRCSSNS